MQKDQHDADQVLKKAKEVALAVIKEAGALLLSKWGHGRRHIDYKGSIDIVTEMDKASEDLIMQRLNKEFPTFSILAEESGAHVGKSEEQAASSGSFQGRWIIDPLDGTTSYAHGFPLWSVSIGLERKGHGIVFGAVYGPVMDELFYAVKGEGAYLNGVKIGVSSNDKLIQSLVSTGFPYDRATCKPEENNVNYLSHVAFYVRDFRRCGTAALELCYVAASRLDAYWEWKLKAWDISAGYLICKEAGGKVTNLKGGEINIDDDRIHVLATNGHIHSQIIQVFEKAAATPFANPAK